MGYTAAIMLEINPIQLTGNWTEAYALDRHTISSEFLGQDQYGHDQYDTKRSQVGEILYRLKYRGDKTGVQALALTAVEFIQSRNWVVDVIVPVPATTDRTEQPVMWLSQAIGTMLSVPVSTTAIVKVKDIPPLKDVFAYNQRLEHLAGAYKVFMPEVRGQSVLVLDDLYRSGATLETVGRCLLQEGQPKSLYALMMTKTRSNR